MQLHRRIGHLRLHIAPDRASSNDGAGAFGTPTDLPVMPIGDVQRE
jgi:hypothetical protein